MAFPDDVTLQYPGKVNGAGEIDAMYLKLFAGEVARQYKRKLVALPFASAFTLTKGKSIQLPYFGKATARFQGLGVNILDETNALLTSVAGAEKEIFADKTLVSALVVSEWDDILNHYSARSIYADALGTALAESVDNILMRLAILGARVAADSIYTGHPGGNSVVNADADDTATELIESISDLRKKFDEKDVPMEHRVLVLKPAQMQLLVQNKDLFNADYTAGDNGDLARGVVGKAFGFDLVQSTNMPSTDLSATSAANLTNNKVATSGNSYAVNASTVVAIAFQRQGLAAVTARGMKMETDYKSELGATLVKASHIMGFGYWRPECCGEIKLS